MMTGIHHIADGHQDLAHVVGHVAFGIDEVAEKQGDSSVGVSVALSVVFVSELGEEGFQFVPASVNVADDVVLNVLSLLIRFHLHCGRSMICMDGLCKMPNCDICDYLVIYYWGDDSGGECFRGSSPLLQLVDKGGLYGRCRRRLGLMDWFGRWRVLPENVQLVCPHANVQLVCPHAYDHIGCDYDEFIFSLQMCVLTR